MNLDDHTAKALDMVRDSLSKPPPSSLSGHLWQAYAAFRRGDTAHAEEHLLAAMNLADPGLGSGLSLIPYEPCLLTGQNHPRKETKP